MEKTNELNKFLSYIHMGNSVFRIYHKECENLKDEKKKFYDENENYKKYKIILDKSITL